MATIRRPRILIALGALALVPAALTACGAGGQSTEEACGVVQDGMTDIQSNIQELMTAATSGDSGAVNDLMDSTSTEISAIKEDITNEEVSTAFNKFADSYQEIAGVVTDLADIDMTDPAAADQATELSTKVTDASTALTDSAQELTETCGG
ncbi:MAG: hypothetical protein ACTHZX_13410 [Microbacterium sp.]